MRPLRLDLAGFAVFREPTTIDFTDADFFALVGPTGSGKSTVLDAICFALYGSVPRWRDARSVANALAPSATEARVRLVFEVAGVPYVATRVVRRDGKGRVKTAAGGLERMPAGFDIRKFDTGLTPEDLGVPLAGTPSELDAAVPEVLGLPYDQFVTCVVLPQGEFAEFLHAKPATRQQILVNLLGLSVYERIRERATARATRAEAERDATDRLLAGLAEVDDAALAEAQARAARTEQLVAQVTEALPRLATAREAHTQTRAALREREQQIQQLIAVRAPAEVTALAAAVTAARRARVAAAEAVTAAEDQEEKLRGELAAAGDPATVRGLLEAQQERDRLTGQRDQLTDEVDRARQEYETAAAALAEARAEAAQAEVTLAEAREAYTHAQATDQAMAVRSRLVTGEPCPVCTQVVGDPPEVPTDSAVAQAKAAGQRARGAWEAAQEQLAAQDGAARERERELTTAQSRVEALSGRLTELADKLAGAPGPEQLRQELAAIAEAEGRLATAAAGVRQAREAHRRAQVDADEAEQRLRASWREFDQARDALAGYRPPPVDRDDLAEAWAALTGWATRTAADLTAGRAAAEAAVADAAAAVAAVRDELVAAFADAGLTLTGAPAAAPSPGQDGAGEAPREADPTGEDLARAAALAHERARAEYDQLRGLRAQAEELRTQRDRHERDAQVARALAQHLRANNFEAWLVAEALDRLVEGASAILRELSGGQYDLVHEGREFFVVDHHDAGLRRPVRTLSGGETFQASLALALALSAQLTGLSTSSASLESIVLDEGFGTLDAATLDAVAATLESLAARGDRVVGVVTHVPALAERIPVRYEVSKDARSARVTRVGL